jgi:hypothetical protein
MFIIISRADVRIPKVSFIGKTMMGTSFDLDDKSYL